MTCRDCAPICPTCLEPLVRVDGRVRCACPDAYPPDWPDIAKRVKDEAGWRCVRCDAPHSREGWRVLTVHHLDGVKANVQWWNLAALCQRCHLAIQARVKMEQTYLYEHSPWFRPYVAGYYAATVLGEDLTRGEVEARMGELIAAGQPWLACPEPEEKT